MPGRRVLVPSFTFTACAQAILYAGGTPCFVDIGPNLTISIEDLGRCLARLRDVGALLPVHLFGHPCDVEGISELVREYSTRVGYEPPVIYDAAHAFGSKIGDHLVGRYGTAEVFSLSATKPMTAIEGGLVTSMDHALVKRIQAMRNYGIESNYNATIEGLNGKLSELHAIVGIDNLKRIEGVLSRRAQIADIVRRQIVERTIFSNPDRCGTVCSTEKDLAVLLPRGLESKRPAMIDLLRGKGVENRTYFSPPLHRQPHFARFSDRRLPITDDVAGRIVILPFHTAFCSTEVEYLIDCLVECGRAVS